MSANRTTPAVRGLLAILLLAAPGWLPLVHATDAEAQRRGARPRQPAEQPAEPESEAQPAQPAAPAAEPEPPPPPGLYLGPTSCAGSNCHGSTVPRDRFGVLQNEYFTWRDEDAHAQAYEVLADERSRVIAVNLRLPQPAYESQLCLDCHAPLPPPELRKAKLEVADGVTCESCHGPASGWRDDHHTAEGWSREDSLAAGLADLSDPSRRAALCLGCHAGDAERRVDHRLLAAGHPQLVFELDNYAAEMPPHWPPPRQYAGERAAEVAAGRGAAAWAIGQAASFRAGLDLLAAQAGSGAWPEFTAMRCTDCHHSLAEERWSGEAGGRQPLGLPRWSPARWAVLRHLVDAFAPARRAELDRRVAALADRVARFAPAAEVAAEARAASAALDGVGGELARVRWDADRVAALLLRLAGDGAAVSGGDRETAEQLFLALNTLTSELLVRRPELATDEMIGTLNTMDRLLDEPHAYDRRRFAGQLERFEAEARAALR